MVRSNGNRKTKALPILDKWPLVTRPRGGGDRERETGRVDVDTSLSPRTPRRLTRLELLLGRWLSERLGSSGGVSMVRRYGWRAVIDLLKYDVMEQQAELIMSGPAAMRQYGVEYVYGPRRWVVRDGIRNAGGFLRTCLREQAGER